VTFTVSFIRFTWNLQAPYSVYIIDIYRPRYSIYMIFTGPLIRFTWYLESPILDLHDIYRFLYSIYMIYRLLYSIYMTDICRPPYLIYMLIYRLLHSFFMIFASPFIQFTWYLQVPLFDWFTWFLQARIFDLHHNYIQVPLMDLHGLMSLLLEIYMIFLIITCFTWNIYMSFTGILKTCKWVKIM